MGIPNNYPNINEFYKHEPIKSSTLEAKSSNALYVAIKEILNEAKLMKIVDEIDDYIWQRYLSNGGYSAPLTKKPSKFLKEPALLTLETPFKFEKYNLRNSWDCFTPLIIYLLNDKRISEALIPGIKKAKSIANNYYQDILCHKKMSFRAYLRRFWDETSSTISSNINKNITGEERSLTVNFLTIASLIAVTCPVVIPGKEFYTKRQPALERMRTGTWDYIKNSEDENHAQIDKYYEFFYFTFLSFFCDSSGRSSIANNFIYEAGRKVGIKRVLIDQSKLEESKHYYKDLPYNVMYNTAGAAFGKALARQKNIDGSKISIYLDAAKKDPLVKELMEKYNR